MIENLIIQKKEDEAIHFSLPVNSDNMLIKELQKGSEIKDLMAKYHLEFDSAQLNIFKGLLGYTLMIPVAPTDVKKGDYVVAYYDGQNKIKNIKVMTLYGVDDTFKITFSDSKGMEKVTGVYKNGNYVGTIKENIAGQVTIQKSLTQCLDEGFKNLPWALQIFCVAACGAIWTGVGLAACAGCLTGLGISCD